MSKINVLVVASDNQGGVGFYRSSQPHKKLEEMYPEEFSVKYDLNPDWNNLEAFKEFNIIHIHKGIFSNDVGFLHALVFFKNNNIVTIMDIDDHWKLSEHHPQYLAVKQHHGDELIKRNLVLFDYVTTTTEFFKKEILSFNKNVVIFPNAIDPTDERFQVHKVDCPKLRIGFIMGSTHEYDLATMDDFVKKLPQEVLEKVEFVLCGYDLRGTMRIYDRDSGEVKTRPLEPKESVWYRYEKIITNNYQNVSFQYRQFLESFIPNATYPRCVEEGYKRCWTKDMDHYYQHYSEIDVLMAPLEENDFNRVKSQLKVIEAAFSHTAIIATNFGPYTLDLKSIFEKGGTINENGNAILIDPRKAHKDWAKAVEKLVKHPEYVKMLQDNLYRDIHEKYDLANVTKQRAEFYKQINKKKD